MPATLMAETVLARLVPPAEVYDLSDRGELRRLGANAAAAAFGPLGEAQKRDMAAAVGRCLLEGGVEDLPLVRLNSGTARPLRASLVPLADGGDRVAAVLCLMLDRAPVRSIRGERLRALLELSSDDLWESDAELRLSRIYDRGAGRQRMTAFVGRTAEEALDRSMPAEDFPRLQAALAARQPFRDLIFPVRSSGGETEWVRLSGFPQFAADGSFTGYLGTSSRVTEERHRLAGERRRQQLESLGQLAGGIAHEFNNLLMPVTMLSKLALGRIGDDETLRLFLTTIHENGWKAADIVRSILTYARQMTPVAGPVVAGEVVAERTHLLRQALPPSVTFDLSIEDRTSRIFGNAGELSLIIVNLFNNASEAVNGNGTIRCSVTKIPLSAVERRGICAAGGEMLRIVVADTGCGIAPELRDRVFEPFFTTKPVGQGTGLGLSVVQGIVKDWGGQIRVAGNPGEGAEFTILRPVLAEEGAGGS